MSDNIVYDVMDRALSAIVRPIRAVLPHIKQVYIARMEVNDSGSDAPYIEHTTEAGDTYRKLSEKYFVEASILVRDNTAQADRKEIDEALTAGREIRIRVNRRSVQFPGLFSAYVGETVYLVVETENFKVDDQGNPRKLKIQLMTGPDSVIGAPDNPLTITHNGVQTDEVELEVGTFLKDSDFTNRADFENFAIARIDLCGDMEAKKEWLKLIGDQDVESGRHLQLYYKADAHTPNADVPEAFMLYYGEDGAGEFTSDSFQKVDGKYFYLTNSGAPWVDMGIEEGLYFEGREEDDDEVKKRVNESYFRICGRLLNAPSANWCSAFLSYLCYRTNYNSPLGAGSQDFKGRGGLVEVSRPVYGAFSVWTNYIKKSFYDGLTDEQKESSKYAGVRRTTETFGGEVYYEIYRGHVGMVFGKRSGSRDGHYLILGGNQNKRIMVREYNCTGNSFSLGENKRRKHTGYYIPEDYALSMADGLTSATDTLEAHDHLLDDHIYPDIATANDVAIGVHMNASGVNIDN